MTQKSDETSSTSTFTTQESIGRTNHRIAMPLPHKRDGCQDYKREFRTKQTVYECPPQPPPVVLQCSVCQTAEHDGANLWSCLPFISYSAFFGPTLGDIVVHVINIMPATIISCLGIGHEKLCRAKLSKQAESSAPVNNYNEECSRVCRGRGDLARGDDHDGPAGDKDKLSKWMRDEYVCLAQELADFKRLTSEDNTPVSRDLLQARNYVLDRLAEMLAKREDMEKRMKKNKNKASSEERWMSLK